MINTLRFAGRPEFMTALKELAELYPKSKEQRQNTTINRLAYGTTDPAKIDKKPVCGSIFRSATGSV
jgi:hypothetical protein